MAKQNSNNKAAWQKAIGAAIGASLLVGLIALAFLWPSRVAEPHNVPIAITGSDPQQVEAIKQGLEQGAGKAINLVSVENREEAVEKIKTREAYGALILTLPSPEILTASANGAALNAITSNMATNLQAKLSEQAAAQAAPGAATVPKITVKVTDVVSTHKATFDIAALTMPLVFGGVIGGVIISAAVSGRLKRLVALALYAISAGTLMYLILHTWFAVIPGGYFAIAGALSLGIFATASFIAGSYVLLGMPGLAPAVLFTLLVANPISGMAIPQLFLPEPWGAVGQALTIGAGGTLVRAAAYFRESTVVLMPLLTLGIWGVLGASAVLARDRKSFR